jgi:hypothetical protein
MAAINGIESIFEEGPELWVVEDLRWDRVTGVQ